MKKIVYAVLATLSGLVLVFSYRTSLEAVQPAAAAAADPVASNDTTPADTSSGSASTGTPDGSASSSTTGIADGTYTGDSTNTRFGPVQVQISVTGGQITDVQVLDYPDGNQRDRQINERALPVLISETTQAQSAQIDMVSGATYTSQGYISSLQSAIDQAQSR